MLNYWVGFTAWYSQLFIVLVIAYCLYAILRLSLLTLSVKCWVHVSANISSLSSSHQETEEGVKYEKFNVEYSYLFNGKEYKSNKVSLSAFIFGLSLGDNKALLEKLNYCFKNRTSVFVWVNPKIPSQAVISKAVEIKYLAFCIMALVFFIYLLLKANA